LIIPSKSPVHGLALVLGSAKPVPDGVLAGAWAPSLGRGLGRGSLGERHFDAAQDQQEREDDVPHRRPLHREIKYRDADGKDRAVPR